MYGPIGCCRRNRNPFNPPPRIRSQSNTSGSVISRRNWRARLSVRTGARIWILYDLFWSTRLHLAQVQTGTWAAAPSTAFGGPPPPRFARRRNARALLLLHELYFASSASSFSPSAGAFF